MGWTATLRSTLKRHVWILDSLLAVAIAIVTLVVRQPDAGRGPATPLAAVIVGSATSLLLAGRRLRPLATAALVILGTGVAVVLARGTPVFAVALVVMLYTVAVRTDRRTTVHAFVAAVVTMLVAILLVPVELNLWSVLDAGFSLLGWSAVAAAVGDAVRSRRAYLTATEERAERAERTREEEARRQVVEERLRIAQELHDVVAHNVAVVSVQAGLADHLFCKQPEAAREALHQVQRASATILDELAGILDVLRHPDDQNSTVAPAPGLSQLDDLVDSYAGAGLPVQVSRSGEPRELAPHTDLVAYRVVQESLTNAHKHGGLSAKVVLAYTPQGVVLDVVNPLPTPTPTTSGTGHGITGMRERASAVGGDLRVDTDAAGEFRVHLALPAPVPQR